LLAWLTLWPTWTPLPVIAHRRAIAKPLDKQTKKLRRPFLPVRDAF
jgi:hypothetical protein